MAKKKSIEELEKEIAKAQEELRALKLEQSRKRAKARRAGTKPPKAGKQGNGKSSGTTTLLRNGRKMTGPVKIKVKNHADLKYTLMDDIKSSPMYGKVNRDPFARKIIEDNCQKVPKNRIVPGQLVLFQYFDPKTKDKLEYYDASPCTIFFGVFNSKQGRRVLGFNIHYYPPRIRYSIMDRIFKIYRPIYTKYFTTGTTREIDAFDYSYLMFALKREGLDFGVREYIPMLIGDTWLIPPNQWQVAVFTEGWFKKQTRAMIMKYWRDRLYNQKPGKAGAKTPARSTGNTSGKKQSAKTQSNLKASGTAQYDTI